MSSLTLEIHPCKRLSGQVRPPSDKSLTHRAFLFAAMDSSPSVVRLPLLGEDCLSTLHALQALGARASVSPIETRIEPSSRLGPSG